MRRVSPCWHASHMWMSIRALVVPTAQRRQGRPSSWKMTTAEPASSIKQATARSSSRRRSIPALSIASTMCRMRCKPRHLHCASARRANRHSSVSLPAGFARHSTPRSSRLFLHASCSFTGLGHTGAGAGRAGDAFAAAIMPCTLSPASRALHTHHHRHLPLSRAPPSSSTTPRACALSKRAPPLFRPPRRLDSAQALCDATIGAR